MRITKKYLNELTYKVIGRAIEVHRQLGPGLLESVYEKCLVRELILNGYNCKRQLWVPINFNCINIFKEGQKTLVNELYAALPDE